MEGREIVSLVLTFMDSRQVWKTQPEAYAAAIRRLQQVTRCTPLHDTHRMTRLLGRCTCLWGEGDGCAACTGYDLKC